MTKPWNEIEHKNPQPGDKCSGCGRRVPHPKKPNSPQSKVVSYRVPIDDAAIHNEVAEAAAEALNILENKYWRWTLHNICYAMILQGSRMEETGG